MPKVLLVDDEHDLVRMLKMLLEFDGFEVEVAPSGEAALVKAPQVQPDVILVDFRLSDIDGTDLIRQLRADDAFANTVIVMTSGLPVEEEALAAGANGFLPKPFDPNEMVAQFLSLLGMA